MPRIAIGLGSNVGDRLKNLQDASARIAEIEPLVARSSLYETVAVGGPAQGDFLNAVVVVESSRDPHALLTELQRIEADLGRVRTVRFGPRTIDLDVLWIEGKTVSAEDLEVPHPRLTERAFALTPLLEVVPDAIDPRTGAPLAETHTRAQGAITNIGSWS